MTLTGSHFTGTTAVRYGSRQATSFTVVSDTTTDTITPSGHGAVPVSVTTVGGTRPSSVVGSRGKARQAQPTITGASTGSLACRSPSRQPAAPGPSGAPGRLCAGHVAGPGCFRANPGERIREVARTAAADAGPAAARGIDLHNPFLDPTVLDTVLRTPLDQRPPLFAYKPLLSQTMTSLLPPAVAARTTNSSFDADHYVGLRANLPGLQTLADGHLAGLGMVNPTSLGRTLRGAAADLDERARGPLPAG